MALCGSFQCGCALTVTGSGALTLSGSGQSGDPWIIGDLGLSWQSYTPSWTNLTVGDGTWTAQYRYVDGGIRVKGVLVFGSTTSISGSVSQTIPNSETAGSTVSSGTAVYDDGARLWPGVTRALNASTSFIFIHAESGANGVVNAANPFTWGSADAIHWDITVSL